MSLPRIATCRPTANLITTPQLQVAYERASRLELRETATWPLFEELLNEYFGRPALSAFGEQQLTDILQAEDITVGYDDQGPLSKLVFVLPGDTERHAVGSREEELESRLQEYAAGNLNKDFGGLAVHEKVYGATAYGTKIRFFEFDRTARIFQDWSFSRNLHVPGEEAYWDLKTDGEKIHAVLKEIWDQSPFSCE